MLKVKPKKIHPIVDFFNRVTSHTLYRVLFPVIIAVTLLIFAVFVIATNFEMNRIAATLIDENSKNKETSDKISQTLLLLTRHFNEVRSQLGLSEKTYPINEISEEEKEQKEQDDNLAYFLAIDRIYSFNEEEKYLKQFDVIKREIIGEEFVKNEKFKVNTEEKFAVKLLKSDLLYFTISYSPENGKINIASFSGNNLENVSWDSKAIDFLSSENPKITERLSKINSMADTLLSIKQNEEINNLLTAKTLTLTDPSITDEAYTMNVVKKIKVYATMGLNKKTLEYFVDDNLFTSYSSFLVELIRTIKKIDTRSEKKKLVMEAENKFYAILDDPAFKTLLETKGYTVSRKPRIEHYYTYFDISDQNGNKAGTFAIDNFTYEMYITDKDEVQIGSLQSLLDSRNEESTVKKN